MTATLVLALLAALVTLGLAPARIEDVETTAEARREDRQQAKGAREGSPNGGHTDGTDGGIARGARPFLAAHCISPLQPTQTRSQERCLE